MMNFARWACDSLISLEGLQRAASTSRNAEGDQEFDFPNSFLLTRRGLLALAVLRLSSHARSELGCWMLDVGCWMFLAKRVTNNANPIALPSLLSSQGSESQCTHAKPSGSWIGRQLSSSSPGASDSAPSSSARYLTCTLPFVPGVSTFCRSGGGLKLRVAKKTRPLETDCSPCSSSMASLGR